MRVSSKLLLTPDATRPTTRLNSATDSSRYFLSFSSTMKRSLAFRHCQVVHADTISCSILSALGRLAHSFSTRATLRLPHPCVFCKGGRGLGRGAGNHGSGATLDTKLMARRVQFPSIKRQPAELISRSPGAKDGAQEPLLRTRKAQEWEGLAASLPTLAKSA